jgi:hypothetical protein
MENVTRTVYGSRLQTMQFSHLPFSTDQNTTLNEKFGVLAGSNPASGVYPSAQYYCIGLGGHQMATGTGGIPLVQAQPHVATDAALYKHLPFVLRATNNDISNVEQQKYALRKTETWGGNPYYAYYLKRIPTDQAVVATTIQTVNGNSTTSAGFTPGAGNLSPTPPSLDPQNLNLLQAQYANVSATLPLVLSASEVTEILNAATIIYGDPSYAIISEIGLVTGVDEQITLPNQNTMMEVICAQIACFINTMHVLQFAATGINGSFDLGTNEPLLIIGS